MRRAAPATRADDVAIVASTVCAGALGLLCVGASAQSPNLWPLLLTLLIAPVLEETVFRAGLHDGLLRRGVAPMLANTGTALVFSAAHLALLGLSVGNALVFVPALLIGLAYNRWRRVRICIALHAAMNALWLAAQRLS